MDDFLRKLSDKVILWKDQSKKLDQKEVKKIILQDFEEMIIEEQQIGFHLKKKKFVFKKFF
jgi:hypothetical protein